MDLLFDYISPLIFVFGIILSTLHFFLFKNGTFLISGILLSIFLAGFAGTFLKYINNPETLKFVVIDYGFVLLCFFLFLYFIGESTKEEQ